MPLLPHSKLIVTNEAKANKEEPFAIQLTCVDGWLFIVGLQL